MTEIEEIIENQAEILKNAKSKEEFEQCWKSLRALVTEYNPDNKEPNCKGCLLLNRIHKQVWELSKLDSYTANYKCFECGINWLSTFCKEKELPSTS